MLIESLMMFSCFSRAVFFLSFLTVFLCVVDLDSIDVSSNAREDLLCAKAY